MNSPTRTVWDARTRSPGTPQRKALHTVYQTPSPYNRNSTQTHITPVADIPHTHIRKQVTPYIT
jgi:hypothetical protein